MSTATLAALLVLVLVSLWLGAISASLQRLSRQERQALRRRRVPCWWDENEGSRSERNEKPPLAR